MDYLYLILVFGLFLLGIVGSFLPVLPGPILSLAGIWVAQWTDLADFSTSGLVLWTLFALGVSLVDFYMPAYLVNKTKGTRSGQRGAAVGAILGHFFSPPGIILGPFFGALLGELLAGTNSSFALRSAWFAFLGFLAGSFLKLIFATAALIAYFLA